MVEEPDDNSLRPTGRFEAAATNRWFTPALFFLLLGAAWTGLTIYFSMRYFWNLVPGSLITTVLYGLAWWFRSQSHHNKIT
jgi:hypothetical protein